MPQYQIKKAYTGGITNPKTISVNIIIIPTPKHCAKNAANFFLVIVLPLYKRKGS